MTVLRPGRLLLGLFVALSAVDFLLTWYLLEHRGGSFYESNPVARWFLVRFGWVGLAGFKTAVVLVVGGTVLLLNRRRPRTANRLLRFACLATGLVVLYSFFLLNRASAGSRIHDDASIQTTSQQLDVKLRHSHQYQLLHAQLSDDLVAGRCTLEEAVDRLAATPHVQDQDWLRGLRARYPNCSDRDCLTASLLRSVGERSGDTSLSLAPTAISLTVTEAELAADEDLDG